ncbi:uncharacterized protein METZ01_LOCUS129968 [marine metagenome]|uniref:Uncharacterized protein n=1 Tax=marine metagenome TaxID=408172 RepID=A0A381YJ90_9ZZZZ
MYCKPGLDAAPPFPCPLSVDPPTQTPLPPIPLPNDSVPLTAVIMSPKSRAVPPVLAIVI